MRTALLARLVWPGMILAGILLAALVWAAWPVPAAPAAPPVTPLPAAAHVRLGPAPVPSELEASRAYEQESPEQLGARPLPGEGLTPAPPPPVVG